MSTENTPREDAELEAFLGRQSNLSTDYDHLELVEPPAPLDEKILALARFAAKPAVNPTPTNPTLAQPAVAAPAAGVGSAIPASPAERRKRPRQPKPDLDDADAAPPSRRPRWLVPAALAATVAVGVGLAVFMNPPTGTSDTPPDGSLFAKRARERGEAGKVAAAVSAEQEAEVVVLDSAPLPPPPVFEPEGPQVQDLDAAIAMIRKELVLVNQTAAVAEEAAASQAKDQAAALAVRGKLPAAPAGNVADTADAVALTGTASVIQPRERRLTKILELYDGGNPDLASDSLEIFLRDFEDDPISQRILNVKP